MQGLPARPRAPGSSGLTLYPIPGADGARGRPAVLESEALVEHAVRATLVADALALQMRLPPPGAPAPAARASAAVAAGAPVMDALALTSVWAVHMLRTLCQARARARPAARSGYSRAGPHARRRACAAGRCLGRAPAASDASCSGLWCQRRCRQGQRLWMPAARPPQGTPAGPGRAARGERSGRARAGLWVPRLGRAGHRRGRRHRRRRVQQRGRRAAGQPGGRRGRHQGAPRRPRRLLDSTRAGPQAQPGAARPGTEREPRAGRGRRPPSAPPRRPGPR